MVIEHNRLEATEFQGFLAEKLNRFISRCTDLVRYDDSTSNSVRVCGVSSNSLVAVYIASHSGFISVSATCCRHVGPKPPVPGLGRHSRGHFAGILLT